MRSIAAIALVSSGCFGPTIAPGGPCTIERECPPGQVCNVAGVCVYPGTPDGATAADAPSGSSADALSLSSTIDEAVEPYEIAAPVTCNLVDPATSQVLAVDLDDRIYVAAVCGGMVSIAVSTTGGRTMGPFEPVGVAVAGDAPIAVLSQGARQLTVATIANDQIVVTTTGDAAQTWSTPQLVGAATTSDFGITMAAVTGGLVVVARADTDMLRTARFDTDEWTTTVLDSSIVYGDVVQGSTGQAVYLVGDNPAPVLHVSPDGGATFGAETNPTSPTSQDIRFSDWDATPTSLIGVGQETDALVISVDDPTLATSVPLDIGAAAQRSRTLHALSQDEWFIGSTDENEGSRLDRWTAQGAVSNQTVDADGVQMSIRGVRSGIAIVTYEKAAALYFSVRLF